MSLAELLVGSAWAEASDPLVHVGGETFTRGWVEGRADALAAALAEAGVGAGHAVAVMLPNGADVVAALFGVWRAGAVYVPLNPRLSDPEVDHVAAAVEPAAVVTTAALAPRHRGRPVVVADAVGWRVVGPAVGESRRYDDDVALIQFTSGTTGRPKPVLLLHSGVLDLLDGVLRKLRGATPAGRPPARPRDDAPPMPNLIPVSLSLWAGIYNVLFALRVDAPVVVMDGFDTRVFADLVARFGIRSTVLPPAAMTMLADDTSIESLSPLRFVRSITAPLSPLQARRFKDRFGIAVLNSYGQTEIGGEIVGWNAADSRQHGEAKLGSVGRPHDGVETRIVDGHGDEAPPDTSGELWVRTPALSAGYADGGDLSDRLAPGGWFRTGDIARVDADGFVWIEGRASDMINRGGLKVFPAEVEEVLRLESEVADVAVVGVPDERLGEVPWAFVVGRHGGPPAGENLAERCRAHLAPYKVPVRFVALDVLPRNEVGKVLAGELVRRAASLSA